MRSNPVILAALLGLAACERAADETTMAPAAPATLSPRAEPEAITPAGVASARADVPDGGRARLPLARILSIVRTQATGEVIEVELEEDDGQESYEVAVLTPEGRKVEITVDARTGRVLEREED